MIKGKAYNVLKIFKRKSSFLIDNTHFIENVYKKEFAKHALVSFITSSFRTEIPTFAHTNYYECKTICEILDDSGFCVDIVDYNYTYYGDANKYDLLIGFGDTFENWLIKNQSLKAKLILYRNGAEPTFADFLGLKRVTEVESRTGVRLLDSIRYYPKLLRLQTWFANKLIVLGNAFVAGTYNGCYSGNIESIDLFYFKSNANCDINKNWDISKQHFLWFGSRGAIHKGLDLLLDLFSTKPNWNLHICGLNNDENYFKEAYKHLLKLDNIHDWGFVDINSTDFTKLINLCGAIISPSLSEGGAGAILNIIANSHIMPILFINVGLDLDNIEILIEQLTIESIENSIIKFQKMNAGELTDLTVRLNKFVRERYSYENYKSNLQKIILEP